MSVTERSKVRRRRSIRLSRQSSALLVPLVSDQELSDCPCEDGIDNASVTCASSSVYNTGNDLDINCGSFWEEVDEEKPRRKNRSRRSNIGFHVSRAENEADVRVGDDDPPCVTHGGSSLTIHTSASLHETEANTEQLGLDPAEPAAETPEIEIPRRPCPDASPYIQTPVAYLTGASNLDLSQSKTPGVISDKSLPSIQTPSSAGVNIVLGSVKEFDDAFMLGMDTPTSSQDALVGCPPSCEDDSEDSLLICTPDLSKFKKNIQFRCSLDFSELDQTPSKGDNPDNSQDSIHESPIVGYIYDKLNASDVIRKRRSISRQSGNVSSMKPPTPKTLGVPKRLLPAGNKPETRDAEEPEANPTFGTREVSVQSSSSSQSSSTSGSYTSCVEEQDILGVADAQPSSLPSPVSATPQAVSQPEQSTPDLPPVPASDVQHTSQPVSVSADAVQTDQCVNESEVNSLGVKDSDDAPHSDKTEASVEFEDIPKQSENDMSVPYDVTLEKESTDDQMSESKSKERNIASDVCEMFRSLARKFSGGKKKKRRSGSLKTQGQPRLLVNEKESLVGENDVAGSDGIFSFRKEPKLAKQLSGESVTSAGDSTPKEEGPKSLDFSPFFPPAENACNVTNVDATPGSPVWKLQSDQSDSVQVDADGRKIGEQLLVSNDGNTPLIIETVLQAKSTNVKCEESEEKLAQKKTGRPKRRSIETSVLRQECKEFQATEPIPVEEEEENSSLRRSRRTRRSSLEMFRHQSQTPEGFGESVESPDSENESKPRKNRGRKKAVPAVLEEDLEELYRNKNYTLPTERMWETLFESPEKSKQPNVLQSRRKYRRTITFDTIPPAKMRKRLQRAISQGWDVTGKKRRSIPLDEVKNKMAMLASEIE